jgi:thioredoxin 1
MFWKKKPKFETTQVTDANFNEVVGASKIPVLLDFYADWCGPCKVLGPIIDELAEEYQGRALVAKVDTEVNPNLGQYFKIKSIPTMMIIHQGKLVERFQGLIPKPNLEEILEEYIQANLNLQDSSNEEE